MPARAVGHVAHWPKAVAESQSLSYVNTPSARIFYECDGPDDAPVVVLSSALGTHHGMWDPQVPALAERFRVLRYDMRGHGASDVPQGPYDIASLGRDVLGMLDGLGLQRVSFCGLSLGGMIGMWLGANAAHRIDRLVLCNTSAYMGNPDAWNARIELVNRAGMSAVADSIIERWFTPDFRRANPAAVERIREMLLAAPPAGYAACCAAVRDMDLRAKVGSISAPTLVIGGTHDAGTTMEHAREIAAKVPGAKLVELNAAHLSNIEAQRDFTAAVLEFLRT